MSTNGRFAIPRQRRSLLPRERLTSALHAGIGGGLTVVHAPAGYGKTSLVAAFAHDLDGYLARWLTLDASCNAPEVLCGQLAAALTGEAGNVGPARVARTDDLQVHLGAALDRACSQSALPLLLVIDNAHELRGADSSAGLVNWLIEALPEGVEMVIAGRESPHLAAVDRRVAAGEALLLTAAELAFTEGEIEELIAAAGSPLPAPSVAAATGGWPVAVMAILAGNIALAGATKPRARAAWERYFVAEVWQSVPARLQPPLLQLGLPGVIQESAAADLLGPNAWQSISQWLEEHHFLIEPLPADGFRLNPLLRQFLRAEFRRRVPAEYAGAAGRTVTSFEAEGRVGEAIELAREAGLVEALAGLLERHGYTLIYQGAFALLWRGFDVVPAALLVARPLLSSMRARVLAHLDRPAEALAAADGVLAGEATGPARIHALLARERALRLLGRYEELRALFAEFRLVGDCDDPGLAGELAYHEATFELSITRDLVRAGRLLRETVARCEEAQLQPLALLAQSSLGQLHIVSGDGPRAVNELATAARGWREWGSTANLDWVLNNLGMGYCLVGDYENARDVLQDARREGLLCGNGRLIAYATASLGDAELALGHVQQARLHYQDAVRMCSETAPDESLAALAVAGLSASILRAGDVQQADFFVRRSLLIAEKLANPYELAFCRMQEAAVRSASNDHDGALSAGRQALALFESIDSRTPLRLAHYRLALACFRANRKHDAQEALRQLDALITEPWMVGVLRPEVRDYPLFAQWAASRSRPGSAFREMLERQAFASPVAAPAGLAASRLPRVTARSLGPVQVSVGGREVSDEAWASSRAKELFFLFLARRDGVRKEEAVEQLYPELPAARTNSAFHSNLYRIRQALYQESIVRRDGAYVLNPDGDFSWDVARFEAALTAGEGLPPGSEARARQYEAAMALYQGPFAEAFFSEWAATLRDRLAAGADEALAVLAGHYAARGAFEDAATCVERILARDRHNEEAAYQFATYRVKAGQPIGALAFLDDFRRTYELEFGEAAPERFGRLRARIGSGAM